MIRKFESESFRPRAAPLKRRLSASVVVFTGVFLALVCYAMGTIQSRGFYAVLEFQLASPVTLLITVVTAMVLYHVPFRSYAYLIRDSQVIPTADQPVVRRLSGETRLPEVTHVEMTPAELHSILAETKSPSKRLSSQPLIADLSSGQLRSSFGGNAFTPIKIPSRHDTPITTSTSQRASLTSAHTASIVDYPEATTVWASALEAFVVSQWLVPLIDAVKKSDSQLTQAFKLSGFRLLLQPPQLPRQVSDNIILISDWNLPAVLSSNAEAQSSWSRRQQLEASFLRVPGLEREDVWSVLSSWASSGRIVTARKVLDDVDKELRILETLVMSSLDQATRGTFSSKFVVKDNKHHLSGGVCVWLARHGPSEDVFVATSTRPSLTVSTGSNRLEKYFATMSLFLFMLRELSPSHFQSAALPASLINLVDHRFLRKPSS